MLISPSQTSTRDSGTPTPSSSGRASMTGGSSSRVDGGRSSSLQLLSHDHHRQGQLLLTLHGNIEAIPQVVRVGKGSGHPRDELLYHWRVLPLQLRDDVQIGRASCRERV